MAEIILAVLCLIVGVAFALLTILGLWAGALNRLLPDRPTAGRLSSPSLETEAASPSSCSERTHQ